MNLDILEMVEGDCEERADVSEEAAGLHEEGVGRSCWVLTETPRVSEDDGMLCGFVSQSISSGLV